MDDQKIMRLLDYRKDFTAALSSLYPRTEIDSFFYLLIEDFLALQRIDLSLDPNLTVSDQKLEQLNATLQRLLKEEPIQYILEKTAFYGLPFYVNNHVLIPRPETEELVTWILSDIHSNSHESPIKILDIGTGSGCIPISLAKNSSNTTITAIDISTEALAIAKRNALSNEVSIQCIQTNILSANNLPEKYDVIVSNPPYVRELEKAEIKNNVLENEPHLALFVEDMNPLLFYDKIANLAKEHLTKEGVLYFEINQYLGKETCTLLQEKGFKEIVLRKDLFGNDRMIKAHL
jgi:release factor glutamine methyltransferase